MFIKNRRAINAVISNLILIAAVIVVGFVALAYASSTSSNYQSQYGQTVNSDIDKMKESLSFEYASYNVSSGNLRVYFLNSGSIDTKINTLSVNSSTKVFTMYYINTQLSSNKTLSSGGEAYLLSNTALTSGKYIVKITTGRNSVFADTIVV